MVHHLDEIMASIQKRVTKDGRVSYRVLIRAKGCPIKSATFTKRFDAVKWSQEKEAEFRLNKHFTLVINDEKHTLTELVDRYISQVLPDKTDKAKSHKKRIVWAGMFATTRGRRIDAVSKSYK